jgi:hypothetical protein
MLTFLNNEGIVSVALFRNSDNEWRPSAVFELQKVKMAMMMLMKMLVIKMMRTMITILVNV